MYFIRRGLISMVAGFLVIGLLALVSTRVAYGQTQQQTPPVSPAIILPPQKAPDMTPGATTVKGQSEESKAGSDKSGSQKTSKGKPDPSKIPAKDPTATGPAFVIGPEDILFVRVWQNPDLSGQVAVGPDGMISLQLIGEVKASGLTTKQLEQELAKKLEECCLNEPEVNVQVQRVNSRTYIIQGDGVNRPGIYPLTRPLTVLEALLAGGGYSPFAKKNKIYVLRGTQKFNFNLNDVSKGKHIEQNIQIQNGDQIYVP